jgi:hypothetical protein
MDVLSKKEFPGESFPAPKTFFIFPNPALITDSFLETAFLRGYECYPIPGILGADYQETVEAIINTFRMSILFFFIEKDEPIDYFVKSLEDLQNRHSDAVRLGVFYNKPLSKQQEQLIQRSFLFDIGIEAGCVPLENSAEENHSLLLNVLAANEVAGRRKAIRLSKESSFSVKIVVDGSPVESKMLDLSVSHFTVQFDSLDPDWQIGTKLSNIKLDLGELTISVRGVVSLKRFVNGKVVFVLRYHSEGQEDELVNSVVNKIIYKEYQKATMDFLKSHLRKK